MGSIVIKVEYGETLRRFRTPVYNDAMKLGVHLREKIRHLFNFSPDAEISLTYIDEDNDEVTLGDNDDLQDVFEQDLDPLRVTVKLNGENNGRPSSKPSGSSAPLMRTQNMNNNGRTGRVKKEC